MKKIICIFMCFLFAVSAFTYTIKTSQLNRYIKSFSLRDIIGQRFFVYAPQNLSFKTEPGGIIPSIKVLEKMLNREYDTKLAQFSIPPFIGIDQEGGKVNRYHFISDFPTMYELAHMHINVIDSILNYQCNLMTLSHINVNFAPVIDYSTLNGANMNRIKRNISRDPDSIELFAKYFISYHKSNRILATLKHFPGYGHTYKGDMMHFLTEYSIFMHLSQYADFIMVSNLIYPFLDSIPAVMSGKIVSLLDNVNSIILTDDIACKAYEDPFNTLFHALKAGNDMFILMDHTLYEPMVDSILTWYEKGLLDSMDIYRGIKKIALKKEYLFRAISNQ